MNGWSKSNAEKVSIGTHTSQYYEFPMKCWLYGHKINNKNRNILQQWVHNLEIDQDRLNLKTNSWYKYKNSQVFFINTLTGYHKLVKLLKLIALYNSA